MVPVFQVCLAFAVCGFPPGGGSGGKGDPSLTPDTIAAAIERSWGGLPGVLVRYKQSVAALPAGRGAASYIGPLGDEVTVSIQGDRKQTILLSEKPAPRSITLSFDGRHSYQRSQGVRGRGSSPGPEVEKKVPDSLMKTSDAFPGGYEFYFECLACPPYEGQQLHDSHRAAYLAESGLDLKPEERPYSLVPALRSGGYVVVGRSRSGGQDCVELKGPGDRVWLDPNLNFALRRRAWSWTPDGPTQFEVVLDDFRKATDGLWLPHSVRQYQHAAPVPGKPVPGKPVKQVTVTVTEARYGQLPEGHFTLRPEPNMFVSDFTLLKNSQGEKAGVVYRHGVTPEETKVSLDRAIKLAGPYVATGRHYGWWAGAVVLLVSWFTYRSAARARTAA